RNPNVLFFHETQQKVIALTIDDAPDSLLTPALLDLFAQYDVKVTFFVIGEQVAGNEALLERMRREGHEVGNHMMKDTASIMLSEEEFLANLMAAEQEIGITTGLKWWRPASGWFSPDMLRIAAENGYRACLGSLYPFDNKIREPRIISWLVRERIHPGAVLVLHEGGRQRDYIVPLLEKLIPQLQATGYQFLTVSELVELEN
ncbi:MAG: peptidoglycan/xylan/chitin deacetylase (PgdA/CDA1 family), partial [Candidatus Krumholzibacteriia bacterium]